MRELLASWVDISWADCAFLRMLLGPWPWWPLAAPPTWALVPVPQEQEALPGCTAGEAGQEGLQWHRPAHSGSIREPNSSLTNYSRLFSASWKGKHRCEPGLPKWSTWVRCPRC